jgi:threonine dehydrogenase-like Zn-dependent dehydrogenase
MAGMMRMSELYQPRTSRLIEAEIPNPGPDDVLIKVRACGVCGSEYFDWNGGNNRFPLYFGHEVTGEVVAVGGRVAGFQRGDRVAGLFRKGFAEYALIDQTRVGKLPDPVSFDEAALGEPLLCIVSGALRTDVGLGKTVAIIGVGFMGLLVLQLMKLKGAYRIIAIDTRPEMLEWARHYGADEIYTPDRVPAVYKLDHSTGNTGTDVVIECTGKEAPLNLAIEMVKCHGILSIVGYHQGEYTRVNLQMLNWKSVDLINAHEKRDDHKMRCLDIGLRLMAKGQVSVKELITNRYALDQIDQAFMDFEQKNAGYIKGIVTV